MLINDFLIAADMQQVQAGLSLSDCSASLMLSSSFLSTISLVCWVHFSLQEWISDGNASMHLLVFLSSVQTSILFYDLYLAIRQLLRYLILFLQQFFFVLSSFLSAISYKNEYQMVMLRCTYLFSFGVSKNQFYFMICIWLSHSFSVIWFCFCKSFLYCIVFSHYLANTKVPSLSILAQPKYNIPKGWNAFYFGAPIMGWNDFYECHWFIKYN
jgi:hypothetical protein